MPITSEEYNRRKREKHRLSPEKGRARWKAQWDAKLLALGKTRVRHMFWTRFNDKWVPEPNSGCWIWTASTRQGYGQFWDGSRLDLAHRVSFRVHVGPIPAGLLVLHKCDNSYCINPRHLYLGTDADNMRDLWQRGTPLGPIAENSKKTHCKSGHEFTSANTYRTKNYHRACRKCGIASSARYLARKKASR